MSSLPGGRGTGPAPEVVPELGGGMQKGKLQESGQLCPVISHQCLYWAAHWYALPKCGSQSWLGRKPSSRGGGRLAGPWHVICWLGQLQRCCQNDKWYSTSPARMPPKGSKPRQWGTTPLVQWSWDGEFPARGVAPSKGGTSWMTGCFCIKGGYRSDQSSSNYQQYTTLTRPNKGETAVCGSSIFVCWMTGEAITGCHKWDFGPPGQRSICIDLVRFGVIIQWLLPHTRAEKEVDYWLNTYNRRKNK